MSATLTPPSEALPAAELPPSNGAPLELPLARGPVKNPGQGIDYELFLDCVHCGLCTASCPTYVETGNENDSPRGRIYLMRHVIDGTLALDDDVKRHLDLCLNCRACETACPSGVQYGRLIEPFREHMAHLEPGRQSKTLNAIQRFLLFKVFPYRWANRVSLAPARGAWRRLSIRSPPPGRRRTTSRCCSTRRPTPASSTGCTRRVSRSPSAPSACPRTSPRRGAFSTSCAARRGGRDDVDRRPAAGSVDAVGRETDSQPLGPELRKVCFLL